MTVFSVIPNKSERERIRAQNIRDAAAANKLSPKTCDADIAPCNPEGNATLGAVQEDPGEAADHGEFPPLASDNTLMSDIAWKFCKASVVEEGGCAVCGLVYPSARLTQLKAVKNKLHVLKASGVTRIERKDGDQGTKEYTGPVIDRSCKHMCDHCRKHIRKGNVPQNALTNGLWLGALPEVLSTLRFMERLLIARVRLNNCFVHVAASGLWKM